MAERKEIIHYCVKCGKGMKYKEKKMLYLYDVEEKLKFGNIKAECPTKRFAFNLCENCANEAERLIMSWKNEKKSY